MGDQISLDQTDITRVNIPDPKKGMRSQLLIASFTKEDLPHPPIFQPTLINLTGQANNHVLTRKHRQNFRR